MIKVIKVWSDNYDGVLFTKEAYKALVQDLSTGDYHTHESIDTLVRDWSGVVTLEDYLADIGYAAKDINQLING